MQKGLIVVPTESMPRDEYAGYVREHPDIDFLSCNLQDLSGAQIDAITEKYDIVAGRARFAHFFKERCPAIHTIEIPITGYDVLHSLNLEQVEGCKVAVVTNYADISGTELLGRMLHIEILPYMHTPSNRIRGAILDARAAGAQVIVGGSHTCQIARDLGLPCRVIQLGRQSMGQTIRELHNIREIFRVEDEKNSYIRKLVDAIGEGIIATGEQDRMITMNLLAESMLGNSRKQYIGRPITDLFPENLSNGSQMVELGGQQIIASRVPLLAGEGHSLGAVITLYRPDSIHSMETIAREGDRSKPSTVKYTFENLIGNSDELRAAIQTGKSYARTDSNVLIVGETGTGKELFAQSIHNASRRTDQPFVAINCAALPANLLESELFGYVEGAFTGASRKGKTGVFEAAHMGTLFLDEISEMDYLNQGRLLRVLQEQYIVRLGSTKVIPIDVRIIAATNRNLEQLVAESRFREDLFYRINVLKFYLPPLRSRGSDAYMLTQCFLRELEPEGPPYTFEPAAVDFLISYRWPGNIRQIRNICERIVATCPQHYVSKDYLLATLFPQRGRREEEAQKYASFREGQKREELAQALRRNHGNIGATAAELGINRTTIWRRMKKYGME